MLSWSLLQTEHRLPAITRSTTPAINMMTVCSGCRPLLGFLCKNRSSAPTLNSLRCRGNSSKKKRISYQKWACVMFSVKSSGPSLGFLYGRDIITCGTSLVGGLSPQKIFKFGCSEMLFSALVMRYVSEKSASNADENGKQLLQVTTIKITEFKENKSIHRLDLSGSTGPGGQLPPTPLTPASYGSET